MQVGTQAQKEGTRGGTCFRARASWLTVSASRWAALDEKWVLIGMPVVISTLVHYQGARAAARLELGMLKTWVAFDEKPLRLDLAKMAPGLPLHYQRGVGCAIEWCGVYAAPVR